VTDYSEVGPAAVMVVVEEPGMKIVVAPGHKTGPEHRKAQRRKIAVVCLV
jgi:hypothetical protein